MAKQHSTALPWTVDECTDAKGFYTIRFADGTKHGDTEAYHPIATVYSEHFAHLIVQAVNHHATMVELLREAAMDAYVRDDGKIVLPSTGGTDPRALLAKLNKEE